MKIMDIPAENRPRERLQLQGPESLSTAELLALILKSGTQKENVLEICHKLLSKYQLKGLSSATLLELQQEHGVGKAKASQIVALFELFKRAAAEKKDQAILKKAKDVVDIYLPRMEKLPQEQFVAVYLDTKNRFLSDQVVTKGILNASLIHPREVFHGAIKNMAYSIIIIHNHPSGDPHPSPEDLQVTEQLQSAAEIIGIKLLDHIIIGKGVWWSWKEHGAE